MIKRFLVVDENPDGRSLLSRTLLRKFPQSLVTECGDATTAVLTVRKEKLDAIIVHRTDELTGLELLPVLRKIAPDVVIVSVSGIDRTRESLAAGATAFLNYDAWLGLGTLVAGLLQQKKSVAAVTAGGTSAPPFGIGAESLSRFAREAE